MIENDYSKKPIKNCEEFGKKVGDALKENLTNLLDETNIKNVEDNIRLLCDTMVQREYYRLLLH